jgi:hypothetical protein
MSRGLKPKSFGRLNVRDKSRTYLRSKSKSKSKSKGKDKSKGKYGGPFATLRMTAKNEQKQRQKQNKYGVRSPSLRSMVRMTAKNRQRQLQRRERVSQTLYLERIPRWGVADLYVGPSALEFLLSRDPGLRPGLVCVGPLALNDATGPLALNDAGFERRLALVWCLVSS